MIKKKLNNTNESSRKFIHKNHQRNGAVTYDDLNAFKSWIDISDYMPIVYDLVMTLDTDGKQFPGWYNGQTWEGYRIKNSKAIVKWKKLSHLGVIRGDEV